MLPVASPSSGMLPPAAQAAEEGPEMGASGAHGAASVRTNDYVETYRRYLGDPPVGMTQVARRMLAAEAIKEGPWRDDQGLNRVRGTNFVSEVRHQQTRLQNAMTHLHEEMLRGRDGTSLADSKWTERALGEVQKSIRTLLALRVKPMRPPQWPERILAIVPNACTDEMADFNSYQIREDLGIPVAVLYVLRKLLVKDGLPLLPNLGVIALHVFQPLEAQASLTPLDAHRVLDIAPLTLARGVAAVLGEVIAANLARAGAVVAPPRAPSGGVGGPASASPAAATSTAAAAAAAAAVGGASRGAEAPAGQRHASPRPEGLGPPPVQAGQGSARATPTPSDSGWSEAAGALAALREAPAGSGAHSCVSGDSRTAAAGLEAMRMDGHRLKAQVALYETFCKPLPHHTDLARKAEMAAFYILPAEHLANVCEGRKNWHDIVRWRRTLLVQAVQEGRASARQSLASLGHFILDLRRSPGETDLKILPDFPAGNDFSALNSYAFHPIFPVLTFVVVVLEAVFDGQAALLAQMCGHLDHGRRYPRRTRANTTATQGKVEASNALQHPERLVNEDLMVAVLNGLLEGRAHRSAPFTNGSN